MAFQIGIFIDYYSFIPYLKAEEKHNSKIEY